MGLTEACEALDCSPNKLMELAKQGILGKKVGKSWRFSANQLSEFLCTYTKEEKLTGFQHTITTNVLESVLKPPQKLKQIL